MHASGLGTGDRHLVRRGLAWLPEDMGHLARALLVAVLFPLVGVSVIGAAPAGARVAQAVVSPPAGHVVLVDWDGFDPDYLATAAPRY